MRFSYFLRRVIFIGCCTFVFFLPFDFPLSRINLHIPLVKNLTVLEIAALMLLWELLVLVERRAPIITGAFAISFFVFFLLHLYSSIFPSERMIWSLKYTFRFFGVGLVAFLFPNIVEDERQLRFLIRCLFSGGALAAMCALIQYRYPYLLTNAQSFFEDVDIVSPTKIRGLFGWPTDMAVYLGSLIPLALNRMFYARGKRSYVRILLLLSFTLLVLLCLLLSRTRGWIVGLFFGLGTLWLIHLLRGRDYQPIVLAGVCVVILSVVAVSYFPGFIKFGVSDLEPSELFRLSMVKEALKVIREHPLKGIGADMFYWTHPNDVRFRTHSLFLEIMVNLGIFGVLTFLWMLWSIVREIGKGIFAGGDVREISIQIGILGSLASYLGHMQVDYFWVSYECIGLFWILIAIGFCAARLGRK
jgi:hypothetical protein